MAQEVFVAREGGVAALNAVSNSSGTSRNVGLSDKELMGDSLEYAVYKWDKNPKTGRYEKTNEIIGTNNPNFSYTVDDENALSKILERDELGMVEKVLDDTTKRLETYMKSNNQKLLDKYKQRIKADVTEVRRIIKKYKGKQRYSFTIYDKSGDGQNVWVNAKNWEDAERMISREYKYKRFLRGEKREPRLDYGDLDYFRNAVKTR